MVAKQNGENRCCGDYHSLNSITKSDRYLKLNINSFSVKLANKQRFSKIDYDQIKMRPDDIAKTTITTPFGLYKFNYMPFGLKMHQQHSNATWTKIFKDINCVFALKDDISIFSDDEISHQKYIDIVFNILHEQNFKNQPQNRSLM